MKWVEEDTLWEGYWGYRNQITKVELRGNPGLRLNHLTTWVIHNQKDHLGNSLVSVGTNVPVASFFTLFLVHRSQGCSVLQGRRASVAFSTQLQTPERILWTQIRGKDVNISEKSLFPLRIWAELQLRRGSPRAHSRVHCANEQTLNSSLDCRG